MKKKARELLTSAWLLHSPCCILTLLGCSVILYPWYEESDLQDLVQSYAGTLILACIAISVLSMAIGTAYFFLGMRNLRAIGHMLAWSIQWSITVLIFAFLSIHADIDPFPEVSEIPPIQITDTLHQPVEHLTGPDTLVLYIETEDSATDRVVETPNLTALGEQHAELLNYFLTQAPRWAYAGQADTFYTHPGHLVLEPHSTSSIPGHVHASIRSLTSGAELPKGYTVIKPGGTFPRTENESNGPPDLALEIDSRHFLLLAWRGAKQEAIAHKAVNAAISAIDARMQELAETPSETTITRMLTGRNTTAGDKPELRVCEPPSQYGIYQAEIYTNPHRAGTISLTIRDIETKEILRRFSFPALYSNNANELFRYDIPGKHKVAPSNAEEAELASLFPEGAPFFALKKGTAHQFFGVAFEVNFQPEGESKEEKLLRRCYKVQAYEKPIEATEKIPASPIVENPVNGAETDLETSAVQNSHSEKQQQQAAPANCDSPSGATSGQPPSHSLLDAR